MNMKTIKKRIEKEDPQVLPCMHPSPVVKPQSIIISFQSSPVEALIKVNIDLPKL